MEPISYNCLITGPGGAGKTRFVMDVATGAQAEETGLGQEDFLYVGHDTLQLFDTQTGAETTLMMKYPDVVSPQEFLQAHCAIILLPSTALNAETCATWIDQVEAVHGQIPIYLAQSKADLILDQEAFAQQLQPVTELLQQRQVSTGQTSEVLQLGRSEAVLHLVRRLSGNNNLDHAPPA